jgi:hypothetical protein
VRIVKIVRQDDMQVIRDSPFAMAVLRAATHPTLVSHPATLAQVESTKTDLGCHIAKLAKIPARMDNIWTAVDILLKALASPVSVQHNLAKMYIILPTEPQTIRNHVA